jgi:serine/threonine-protein kinase RsbW
LTVFGCAGEPDGARTILEAGGGEDCHDVGRKFVEISIPSDTGHLPAVRSFLRALMAGPGWACPAERVQSELELVLQEACVNAIRHAGGSREREAITVAFDLFHNGITIEVRDLGRGFDIDSVPEPRASRLQEGGYGVFIIQEIMDRVEVRRRGRHFVLSMTRFFDGDEPASEGR